MNSLRYLVTGCLGFIGSTFVKYLLRNSSDVEIIGVNRFSNQRNLARLKDIIGDERFSLYYADLAKSDLSDAFADVDYVVNFAAKTFVDYSIRDPMPFIESNVVGTFRMLEMARKSSSIKKFIQISTDEVYGAILDGKYTEESRLNPTNPYAAAKAGGDALALAYFNTYKLPIIITRTENNYGPYQSREKVFPTFIRKGLNNEPLPVYGDGKHRRMWLYVEDHCSAILKLIEKGENGQIYHVAGEQEMENIELAKRILNLLGKPESQIAFVPDHDKRPGHDRRYALDCTKLRSLGWVPAWNIDEGFKHTVGWYYNNQGWFC